MRLRFTIRDLLWLLIVAGFAIGWAVERFWHSSLARENAELKAQVRFDNQQRRYFLDKIDELNRPQEQNAGQRP